MRKFTQPIFHAALLAVPAIIFAQAQPPIANNNQDEEINFNRTIGEDVSAFSILRTNDQVEFQDYVSEVIELEHAVALEVIPHVLRAVRLEEGSARALKYEDPEGIAPTRYFIQVVTTREQMPSVLDTIRALDLPGVVSSEGDIKYHYRLKYRRASEVSDILRNTVLSGEGRTFADDETNTIYIQDSVSDGTRDIIVAKFYDVPPPQVEFDVLAVEYSEDESDRLGLEWDAWKRAIGGEVQLTGNWFEGGDIFARMDSLLTMDATALASFLNYTSREGIGEVITRTTITATNNRPGLISSRRRIPAYEYVTTFSGPSQLREPSRSKDGDIAEIGTRPVIFTPTTRSFLTQWNDSSLAPGATATDPSLFAGEKSEGIYLLIEPTIGTQMVTADIRVVVNSMVGLTRLGDPIISESLLTTSVTLEHDEPFALGSLDKKTVVEERRGIPGLKEIPVVKYLFSVETEEKRDSKIYVVITPHFRNQVLFVSEGLMSSKPEIDPATMQNLPLPTPALLEDQYRDR